MLSNDISFLQKVNSLEINGAVLAHGMIARFIGLLR